MNEESRRLASELAAMQTEILNPTFLEIKKQLLGSLATSAQHLESLQHEGDERVANKKLISHVIDLFPKAEGDIRFLPSTVEFSVSDQYTARAIQSCTLWWQQDGLFPSYIIGDRLAPESSDRVELLLFSACRAERKPNRLNKSLDVVDISRTQAEALKNFTANVLYTPFKEKDIEDAFDLATRKLKISGKTQGSICEESVLASHGNRLRTAVLRAGPAARTPDDLEKRGLRIKWNWHYREKLSVGLSDEELGSFGVVEQLGKLAAVFGAEAELQKILLPQPEAPELPEA